MKNYSYQIENYDMIKFFLTLKDSRKGISYLLGDFRYNLPTLRNNQHSNLILDNILIQDNIAMFNTDEIQQKNYLLYDFIISNANIDINLITILLKTHLKNNHNKIFYDKYIFIIEKYINNFDCTDSCDNPNDKYYCYRDTLIYMYNTLLCTGYNLDNLKTKLSEEFNNSLLLEYSKQPTSKMIREYIKNLYNKIMSDNKNLSHLYKLITCPKFNSGCILKKYRSFDILFEYLITIPEFLQENKNFKIVVYKKIFEIINLINDNQHIEAVHLMDTIRKLKSMLDTMES